MLLPCFFLVTPHTKILKCFRATCFLSILKYMWMWRKVGRRKACCLGFTELFVVC
ncbi:hypothetical protein BX070DRAFT_227903 [Coemansia spiralis]|nr:hypothetical protein BX070DRAFT_227903 [Coemansia spiralis]